MRIVDLTVPIGNGTPSPPIVDFPLELTSMQRGPGFWQASRVEMLLHTGSHVDFSSSTTWSCCHATMRSWSWRPS